MKWKFGIKNDPTVPEVMVPCVSVPESPHILLMHCAHHWQLLEAVDTVCGQGNTLGTRLFAEVGLTKPNDVTN